MDTQQLQALLGSLVGHVKTDSPQQEKELDRLHQSLTRSLLLEDIAQLKSSHFSFESADLFFPEQIPAERTTALQTVAETRSAQRTEPEFRVFVREVPVRSTQLHASTPLWAGGAAVDHTIGPLTNKDGRQFWFDFFRIEKLVALYIQGRSDPALLLKVTIGLRFLDANRPPIADLFPSYTLPAGSIWINSQLLAPNAPAGNYTGLTIRGGRITLSAPPQLINGKLTITPNTTVTVTLALQQPIAPDADPSSPYGADARSAAFQLPQQFSFRFSGLANSLTEISSARWTVYGHDASFTWDKVPPASYDNTVHRILIPFACSRPAFQVTNSQSPFHTLAGHAPITSCAWALPSAPIDVLHPTPAAGIGALLVKAGKGLTSTWTGLQGGELTLNQPYIMAEPGRIAITDLTAGTLSYQQTFQLWKDEQNPYGTTVEVRYPNTTPFYYNTLANGIETLMVSCNADVRSDRPVTVAGEAIAIRSKNSLLFLGVSKTLKLLYLFDDNILFDNVDFSQQPPVFPKPIALALHNALFKVTPVNGCLLFGELADDFRKVAKGALFLTFGLQGYLPTLPDPYAANLGTLRSQFRDRGGSVVPGTAGVNQNIRLWLVALIRWQPMSADKDTVDLSFHFAPLQDPFQLPQNATATPPAAATTPDVTAVSASMLFRNDTLQTAEVDTAEFTTRAMVSDQRLPDYEDQWDERTQRLQQDTFALLDVSTNADLLGISFNVFDDQRMAMVTTHAAVSTTNQATSAFPIQVQGMDVVSRGINVRAFTVPQISWEPVFNLTPPSVNGDPPGGFNYYPNDGGPTRLINNSDQQVTLAPIPLTNFLVSTFDTNDQFAALALFTLPFGLKALALLQKQYPGRKGTEVEFNSKAFVNDVTGARQLAIHGGEAQVLGQGDMFKGSTVQLNNILDLNGNPTGDSTLGKTPTIIFNNEFFPNQSLMNERGVPLTRFDLSGYGASMFSNWLNPKAPIASTSQAKFDVIVGRTGHEIIQVKSLMYPWAIKVVRTITLFRTSSGYVYRHDSGWRAESDGRFDFTYYAYDNNPAPPPPLVTVEKQATYEIHPGIIKGLFNVKDIKETEEIAPYTDPMVIAPLAEYVNQFGVITKNGNSPLSLPVNLQPVFFNADVEIENPLSGYITKKIGGQDKKLIPSKHILGFVQVVPLGQPLTNEALQGLINRQLGTIGGPIDCVVNISSSGQQMRLNRFDLSNSVAANGTSPTFVAAGRGNVILPKDGSWSMVQHQRGTGEVTPVPQELSVPLIRIGKLIKQGDQLVLDKNPANELLRIANPTELLRTAVDSTINYGFLHSTDTQKALFLTPAFKQGVEKMLSKTPPLFVDAFRIVNSKAVFPNVGNAANTFGDAISLFSKGTEFTKTALTDGGQQVLEIMQIDKVVNNVNQQGYELLKKVEEFDLPNTEWKLIEIGGAFKIYIEYKADKVQKPKSQGGGSKDLKGSLNFDVDSFANNLADTWKSRMSNVGLVVDLGPIKRLMTIKGNWDAKKGAEAQYKGSDTDPDFPSPQIEFAPELKPVIEILQILQDLQGENYKDAFQRGLKLAMSNKAGTWEYKFEAAKEIPAVRFPMPNEVYNQPTVPLKLEAGLKLGAYFNAALKVTTDPSQLLPTAGGFLEFYGRLSVMCVSLAAATVYAVGQANVRIAADTKTGPSLTLKFGFGAQIVVGLPVVGNVSVLYMVGAEMYVDAVKLNISASMLFQGHAELLGGIVAVTITIEAKGTISRANDRTDLAAQVTFGLDISIFLIIDISFSTSWQEQRQIA